MKENWNDPYLTGEEMDEIVRQTNEELLVKIAIATSRAPSSDKLDKKSGGLV